MDELIVPERLAPCRTYGRRKKEISLPVKSEPIDICMNDFNSSTDSLNIKLDVSNVSKSEEIETPTTSSHSLSMSCYGLMALALTEKEKRKEKKKKPTLTSYSSTQFHKSTQYNHYLQLKENYKNRITQVNLTKNECNRCFSAQPKLNPNHITHSNDSNAGPKIVRAYSLPSVQIAKRNVMTQCYRLKESSSKSQQSKYTQCKVVPVIFRIERGIQTEAKLGSKVTNKHVQTDNSFGKNPQYPIIFQIQLVLNRLKYVTLHYHLKRLARGEMAIFITPGNICGILNDETDPINLTVTDTGKCTLSVIFKTSVTENIVNLGILDEEALCKFLDQLVFVSEPNNFVVCPGLYNLIGDEISRVKTKRLKKLTYPTLRYQARECPVIFNRAQPVKFNNFSHRCSFCYLLGCSIRKSLRSKKTVSQATKLARLRVDSNYPISRLSVKDRNIRLSRCKSERNQLLIKVKKLQALLDEKEERSSVC